MTKKTKTPRQAHLDDMNAAQATSAEHEAHRAECPECATRPEARCMRDLVRGDRIDRIGWGPVKPRTVTRVRTFDNEGAEWTRLYFTQDDAPEAGTMWASGPAHLTVDMLEE